MQDHQYAIDIRGFSKRYDDKFAVKDLELQIRRGTFFGFVGPNGAGKTTTINALVGLVKPSDGSLRIMGYDIAKDALNAKANIGFMPEEVVLYERMTIREYLDFVGHMYQLAPAEIKPRGDELIEMLDLDASKYMGAFSLGMKKKAALAAALIHKPSIIILDEPFSAIDATTGSRIRTALNQMVNEGHTVFFSSHVLETVERVSREIGIIHNGKLLSVGSLEKVQEDAGCSKGTPLEDVFLVLVGAKTVEEISCQGSDT